MVDPNKIRLYPIDFNMIKISGDNIMLECEPSLPLGWEAPPGAIIGGSDVKSKIAGSNVKSGLGGHNVKGTLG